MKSTKGVEEVHQRSRGSPPMKWRKLAHLQGEEAHHEVERESLTSFGEVRDGTTNFLHRVDAAPPNEWRKLTN
ncbi:hypothetical protein ACLB2K_047130 [Fragaria x ananassa]